ncbi:hypothetical protein [Tautonia plasticadhaerens]|uniref:NAD(P)H:quinone oxidoreductase n=1 Tax=Tautonia plasticadhaerens TaxID=2527974 RepID=A0A518H4G6_9BACT|nr:hypothetical protein [Tautonia plasticadhaerens]QDV35726.1 NAD(P)H:quinone oxidoreductase [Tautonia plasticadhaerens]
MTAGSGIRTAEGARGVEGAEVVLTPSAPDDSRPPSEIELVISRTQGRHVADITRRVISGGD